MIDRRHTPRAAKLAVEHAAVKPDPHPMPPLRLRAPRPRAATRLVVPLAATLAAGVALAGPVLALAYGRLAHPRPAPAPPAFDRPGAAWTGELVVPGQTQAAALDALVWIALAVALLVLAGAAVNLGTLLLTRASARREETAIRAVLGATPGRLVRGALAEGAAVGLAGGAAGVALGAAAAALLHRSWPGGFGLLAHARPAAGLGFAAAALVAVVLVVAPLPALRGARRNLHAALTTGGRATAGRAEGLVRRFLTVLQFAAAATLATGAILLVRGSVGGAEAGGPGFDARDTLTFRVAFPASADGARADAAARLLDAVRAVPGVRDAAAASPGAWLALGPRDRIRSACDRCMWGGTYAPMMVGEAAHHAVSPGYFRALGIPLLSGRELQAEDERAVVVNRALAARLLPAADPVGQHLVFDGWFGERFRIVGVVGDVRPAGLGTAAYPPSAVYFPARAAPPTVLAVAVRTAGDPREAADAVLGAAARAAPGASVGEVRAMEDVLRRHRAPLRWFAALLAALAAGALLLSAGGLYGVMRFSVARRTREMGVRMALGARPGDVVRHVLWDGVRLAAIGSAVGAVGAATLARLLQATFAGVRPLDPAAYAVVAGALAAVALAAAWLPARRAARVDPMIALRAE